MLNHIPRRRILIAALAGAILAALGVTIASSHAATSADRNGRIVFTHRSLPAPAVRETDDDDDRADGSGTAITESAPGGNSADPRGPTRNWVRSIATGRQCPCSR
jgi:hypothetical protein